MEILANKRVICQHILDYQLSSTKILTARGFLLKRGLYVTIYFKF